MGCAPAGGPGAKRSDHDAEFRGCVPCPFRLLAVRCGSTDTRSICAGPRQAGGRDPASVGRSAEAAPPPPLPRRPADRPTDRCTALSDSAAPSLPVSAAASKTPPAGRQVFLRCDRTIPLPSWSGHLTPSPEPSPTSAPGKVKNADGCSVLISLPSFDARPTVTFPAAGHHRPLTVTVPLT